MASALMKVLGSDKAFIDVLNTDEIHYENGSAANMWGGLPFYEHTTHRAVGKTMSWRVIFSSRRVPR